METNDAITKRRSVKHFDPSHRLTESEVAELLRFAALGTCME